MSRPGPSCAECGGAGWVFLHAANEHGTVVAVEASCPTCCAPSAAVERAWRQANRWSPRPLSCRYCRKPTHLQDEHARPAHKFCAETAPVPTVREVAR